MKENTMRRLIPLLTLATLGGCVVAPPAPRQASYDPYQWHVVSVTPSQRAPGSSSQAEFTSEPIAAQPVQAAPYAVAPVYAPAPVYVQPPYYAPAPAYYYPPVSIGLDFVFGFGRHWGGGGHYRRR
jgi:hypothetical protein